jgi:hypothetical protein
MLIHKQTTFKVELNLDSSTSDVSRYLRFGRNDSEITAIVSEINRQGKALYGRKFHLRFDQTIQSKDVTRRCLITLVH